MALSVRYEMMVETMVKTVPASPKAMAIFASGDTICDRSGYDFLKSSSGIRDVIWKENCQSPTTASSFSLTSWQTLE
jgi:hypothetical protein